VISDAESSNKFQKTRFWKEESVEDVITLGPTAEATLVSILFLQQLCNSQFNTRLNEETLSENRK
jgi:hypothetical protein